jgi:hypothetical protein
MLVYISITSIITCSLNAPVMIIVLVIHSD